MSSVWPDNSVIEDDAANKRIIIARPVADAYEIYAEFTDGTNATYPDLMLKTMNSVSLKDGKVDIKKDFGLIFTAEEYAAVGLVMPVADVAEVQDTQVQVQFVFKNKTGLDAVEAYVYPSGSDEHFENILPNEVWANNLSSDDYLWIDVSRPSAVTYDIYVLFSDGTVLTYPGCDFVNNNSASMKDATGTMSLKYDDTYVPANNGDAAAETVPFDPTLTEFTLEFVFKNKTDKTISAVYVYPMDSADKGKSILAAEWPNCERDADYLQISIVRPNAELYEIYVEYVDGTNATFPDCDLRSNNSVSMNSTGAIFIKND